MWRSFSINFLCFIAGLILKITYATAEKLTHQPKLLGYSKKDGFRKHLINFLEEFMKT